MFFRKRKNKQFYDNDKSHRIKQEEAHGHLTELVGMIDYMLMQFKKDGHYTTNSTGIIAMLTLTATNNDVERLQRYKTIAKERRAARKGFFATFFWGRNKQVDKFYGLLEAVNEHCPDSMNLTKMKIGLLDTNKMKSWWCRT